MQEFKPDFKFFILEFENQALRYIFTLGENSFSDLFPAPASPSGNSIMLNLKKWLKALVIGVQEASFHYSNLDNDYIFFKYKTKYEIYGKHHVKRSIFEISSNNKKIDLKFDIDRKWIIKEIYEGIMKFANSEYYRKRRTDWEEQNRGQAIAYLLNIPYEKLIDEMLQMKIPDMKKYYLKHIETILSSFEELGDISKMMEFESKEFSEYINKNFNNEKIYFKKAILKDFFNSLIINCGGEPLTNFKSEFIEKYFYLYF